MRFIASAISKRFDHPILAVLFMVAGLLAAVGLGIDLVATHTPLLETSDQIMMTATFLGVYAIFFTTLGGVAFLVLLVVRYASVLRDRASPTSSR